MWLAHLVQELHVLSTESSLAELEKLVGRCRIVQDDLEDLRAEEVGDLIGRDARRRIVRGCRHGGASVGVGVVTRRLSIEGCSSPLDKALIFFNSV